MRIFIIGGTGFISSRLVDMLLSAGHTVDMMTRGISSVKEKDRPGLTHLMGDRDNLSDLRAAADNNSYDAVFDMVAYLPEQSALALEVFKGKVGRFIHCSTISVYMISHDITCPVTSDQDHMPIMPLWPENPFGMDYGIKKRECEALLWQHHNKENFPLTVLRPTYISGPGDPARRDYFWIQRIMDGGPLLVPGSGDIAFQQVYVDDVARAFASMLENDRTIGKKYNVASEDIYSLKEYLLRLARLLGRDPEIVTCNQKQFDQFPFSTNPAGDVFPFNTRRISIFDLYDLKKDTGYHSTPFDVWMQKTIDSISSGHAGDSCGYEFREQELAMIKKIKKPNSIETSAGL